MKKAIIATLLGATLIVGGGAAVTWHNYFNPKEAIFTASAESDQVIDHAVYDAFLKKYVKADDSGLNLLAYGEVSDADHAILDDYIESLAEVKVSKISRAEQFAYWVNLYNALTVQLILENYPLDSIRDIGTVAIGPWGEDRVTIEGRDVSLDDIEHAILRPNWKDVRIHYAVNCASVGCPNLSRDAFTAANTEQQLEAGAVAYINSPRGFAEIDGELIASNIFNWYQIDWGSEAAVLQHARKYARGDTAKLLATYDRIDGYDYDWNLNE